MPLVASIYSLCTCFFSVNYIHSIYIHLFICGTCSHISKAKPYGFDVGQSERGNVLKGLDLGVQGMRVGGQVRSVAVAKSIIILHIFMTSLP